MKSPREPRVRRTAVADAVVSAPEEFRELIGTYDGLLADARVAGILAARRAGQTLPHTPAVEVDAIEVSFSEDEQGIAVEVRIEGFSRGNLASRALLCATTCAVAIVDALPEHADRLAIREASVTKVEGGLAGLSYDFEPPVRAAVLVVSDAVAGGHKEDRAGEIVRRGIEELADHGVELTDYGVVGDVEDDIRDQVKAWADDGVDLVLTVGGTGVVHTDTTIEAIEPLIERPIPGLIEALRDYGLEQTPLAYISRGVAGLVGETLIVTLPGSRGGARESIQAVFPSVLHVFYVLRKSRRHLAGD